MDSAFVIRWYCSFCQANRSDKYEIEISKLRERLNELDFVKTRIDELRAENHILLETKQELEYQLSSKDEPLNRVVELEKELKRDRRMLEKTLEVSRVKLTNYILMFEVIVWLSSALSASPKPLDL